MLARLVAVLRDGSAGESRSITDEAVDLGRSGGDLIFDDDPYLSERHCRFSIQQGEWIVEDLSARNGVYLRLDGPQELRSGDYLLLGKQVLQFELLGEEEQGIAPAVEHGVMVFGSPLGSPWGRLRQVTVAGVARDIYHLTRDKIVLGREDGDLTFPDDEFMSRRHLALTLSEDQVTVEDLGSSNGTFLRVRRRAALQAGDMLRIGDQLLRFEL